MTDIPKQTKIANKFSWTSTVEFHSPTLIFMVKSNNFFLWSKHIFVVSQFHGQNFLVSFDSIATQNFMVSLHSMPTE